MKELVITDVDTQRQWHIVFSVLSEPNTRFQFPPSPAEQTSAIDNLAPRTIEESIPANPVQQETALIEWNIECSIGGKNIVHVVACTALMIFTYMTAQLIQETVELQEWKSLLERQLDEKLVGVLEPSQYQNNSFAQIDQAWSKRQAAIYSLCENSFKEIHQMEQGSSLQCDFDALRSKIATTCSDAKQTLEETVSRELDGAAKSWIQHGEALVEKDTAFFRDYFRSNAYDCAFSPSELYRADTELLSKTSHQMTQEFYDLQKQLAAEDKEFAHKQTTQAYNSVFDQHKAQHANVLAASLAAAGRLQQALDRNNEDQVSLSCLTNYQPL